jgi:hypothetical protein
MLIQENMVENKKFHISPAHKKFIRSKSEIINIKNSSGVWPSELP